MTHEREHVIIHKLSAPVVFSATATESKVRVWHLGLALVVAGFLLGLALA